VQEWVTQFAAEVDRIEAFFKENLKALKTEFDRLNR
jgi:hypothetical protein